MKKATFAVFSCLACIGIAGCTSTAQIEVMVVPHCRPYGELTMAYHYADLPIQVRSGAFDDMTSVDFVVVIANVSNADIFLYEEWNSMGYEGVEIEIAGQCCQGTSKLVKRAGRWDRNVPSAIRIKPGGSLAYPVALDPEIWANVPAIAPLGREEAKEAVCDRHYDYYLGDELCVRATIYAFAANEDRQGVRPRATQPFSSKWTRVILRGRDLVLPYAAGGQD